MYFFFYPIEKYSFLILRKIVDKLLRCKNVSNLCSEIVIVHDFVERPPNCR